MRNFFRTAILSLGVVAPFSHAFSDQQPLSPDSLRHKSAKPNIIFILTDDQDLQLASLSYTPIINRELGEKGTFYQNHFVTTALCCPSRVSLWTGRQAHNTNVTDVNVPYGGYPKFVKQGFNDNFLPVWLQNAGYNTFYTGKLFNAHTVFNYDAPFVNGLNASDFLLDPFTYSYLNSSYQRNRDPPVSYEGQYTQNVLAEKAYGFLDDALAAEGPFFLVVAPVSPHSNVEIHDPTDFFGNVSFGPPIPLPKHKHLFKDVKVPRTAHFNPDKPSGVNWIADLPKQDQENVDYNDEFYRDRLRALQSVDELVGGIIKKLEDTDALENTYIIYTSDNGFHIGQHRLQPGKECGFEEDIRVPLFIRGPDVPANISVDTVTTHIDLAPTIFDIAGIKLREDFDGTPVPIREDTISDESFLRHEHVAVEFWGLAIGEGKYGLKELGVPLFYPNNTYKATRVIGNGYNLYYSVWCNNVHQLYDLDADPLQLNNIYPSTDVTEDLWLLGYPLSKVIARLDALSFVLKSCKGVTCIKPWDVLHPEGDVKDLRDALDKHFDEFYSAQVKVHFNRCEFGYILEAEGPQEPLVYRSGGWSNWT